MLHGVVSAATGAVVAVAAGALSTAGVGAGIGSVINYSFSPSAVGSIT